MVIGEGDPSAGVGEGDTVTAGYGGQAALHPHLQGQRLPVHLAPRLSMDFESLLQAAGPVDPPFAQGAVPPVGYPAAVGVHRLRPADDYQVAVAVAVQGQRPRPVSRGAAAVRPQGGSSPPLVADIQTMGRVASGIAVVRRRARPVPVGPDLGLNTLPFRGRQPLGDDGAAGDPAGDGDIGRRVGGANRTKTLCRPGQGGGQQKHCQNKGYPVIPVHDDSSLIFPRNE